MSFESSFPELPPRFRMYSEALGIYQQLRQAYLDGYQELHGKPFSCAEHVLNHLPYISDEKVPLQLPSIGANAISFYYVGLEDGSKKALDNVDEHRLVAIEVNAYLDGEPHIAKEDKFIDHEVDNSYLIILGRESEPVIANQFPFSWDGGWVTPERLERVRKVPLSDQECEDIISAFRVSGAQLNLSGEFYG